MLIDCCEVIAAFTHFEEMVMRVTLRPFALAAAAAFMLTLSPAAQTREGVMGDLLRDIGQAEKKIVGLAKAMPESAYAWRPAKDVRSSGEVFLHVASDNYFIPHAMGIPAPPETGITKEFSSAVAFEKKAMGRDAVVAELEKSFAFLKASMSGMPDDKLDAPLQMFGQKFTNRGMWIMATTHLHEHLGQLIAYARSNNVTPPWSK